MNNDLNSNSRSGYRAKRKKTNLVLNSLIVIVFLLILFVAYKIFVSGSDTASTKKETPVTTEKQTVQTKEQKDTPKKSVKKEQTSDTTSSEDQADKQNKDNKQSNDPAPTDQADESQAVVSNGGSSANVLKTIENPAWKPVGTSQTGSHAPTYNTESVDWQEMLNAISYATGLEQSNMIVQFLGRDKSTDNGSVGTVYSRDKQQKYKVYIKWVDNGGWQPTKVEELAEIK